MNSPSWQRNLLQLKMGLVYWQRNNTGSLEYQINGNQFASPAQLMTNFGSYWIPHFKERGTKTEIYFVTALVGFAHGFMVRTLESSCHLRLREQGFLSKERTVRQGPGACFSKVPITFRARKAILWSTARFTLKNSNLLKLGSKIVSWRNKSSWFVG